MSEPENYLGVFGPRQAESHKEHIVSCFWANAFRVCSINSEGKMLWENSQYSLHKAEDRARECSKARPGEHYFVLDLTGIGPQQIEVET